MLESLAYFFRVSFEYERKCFLCTNLHLHTKTKHILNRWKTSKLILLKRKWSFLIHLLFLPCPLPPCFMKRENLNFIENHEIISPCRKTSFNHGQCSSRPPATFLRHLISFSETRNFWLVLLFLVFRKCKFWKLYEETSVECAPHLRPPTRHKHTNKFVLRDFEIFGRRKIFRWKRISRASTRNKMWISCSLIFFENFKMSKSF